MQVEELKREGGQASEDVQALSGRCLGAEAERARLTEMVTTLEGRLSQAQQELAVLRAQAQVVAHDDKLQRCLHSVPLPRLR